MRRADRLFAIVQYLRGRRLTTAAQLAQWLEVSERTVYRDVADLAGTGVPIDGEAGAGPKLAGGARSALSKIAAALPGDKRAALESSPLFAPGFFVDPKPGE